MEDARRVLRAVRADGRTSLFEHEAYDTLSAVGLATPPYLFLPGAPGAELPADALRFLADRAVDGVVVKIVAADLAHKSDAGGVAFPARDAVAVAEAARGVWERVGRSAPSADRRGVLLLSRLVPRPSPVPVELLLSIKQDAAFGPVLVLGIGGVLTEWFARIASGATTLVLEPGRVRETLAALDGASPLALFLRPSRLFAAPPVDVEGLADALEALGRLATAFAPDGAPDGDAPALTLEELEVNPLLLTADGRLVAADGKGRISTRRETPTRRPLGKVAKLLAPKSAAVVGASGSSLNPGRIILRNLKVSEGLTYGHLHAVHPRETAIDGIPCRKSLSELPEKVDLVVVAVPSGAARDAIVTICREALADAVILIPGGFAETGQAALEADIRSALREAHERPDGGPVLIGGNCLGVVSKHEYNTFFLPQHKLPFHDAPGDGLVAVSQSGAYLVSLTSNLDGIVFPRASISYGNQMDLTVADFLEYFEGDPTVRVIACYVEGFAPLDGARFIRSARRLRERGTRVIAFKAGKTELGAEATRSHTASLAGDYAVARALLLAAGVVVAESLDMFEDYTKVFTMLGEKRPSGRRLGVVSNAGFECGAVLDKLYGLVPAALSEATRRRLAHALPEIAHADNPVDATPMATTSQFVEAAAALLDDPGVDALLVSPIPVTPTLDDLAPSLTGVHEENIYSPGSLLQELLRLFRGTAKPMVVNVDSGRLYDDFVTALQRGGIPVFRKIDRASRALSALATL